MLNQVSEPTMHRIRWILTVGWLLLITSMFYDPITPNFTHPDALNSPFHLDLATYLDPDRCIKIRETCVPQEPFSMSPLIWWAMIVPAGILILLLLGHEFWRRICPLSFLSQIPRALGIQRQNKIIDPLTQTIRYEPVIITENSWLGRNHLYVQFSFFVLGLGLRILLVNGDRTYLGWFLLATIGLAILVGYLFAGKSWCQYFCPMAPVQMVYTGTRSLLGSQAHLNPGVSQSMCRTMVNGIEQSSCVACKKPCIDIDAEKTYWQELNKPGRRLVQYGYLGMVIAFYLYYYLYSGNWDYYFSGTWTHETNLVQQLLDPGFYLYHHAILIPKAIAVFLTYGVLIAITFSLGLISEKLYRRYASWRGRSVSAEQAQHVVFSLFTAVSFWVFFSYGARPSLNRLPLYPLLAFNALIVAVGAVWLYRSLQRTRTEYERESMATSLRKQLQRIELDESMLQGRTLEQLTPDELYLLVKVLPVFTRQLRLQTYTGVLTELLEQGVVHASRSFDFCYSLRQELQLVDEDHMLAIASLTSTNPEILVAPHWQPFADSLHEANTLAKTIVRPRQKFDSSLPK
jgi:hypothetical protein